MIGFVLYHARGQASCGQADTTPRAVERLNADFRGRAGPSRECPGC